MVAEPAPDDVDLLAAAAAGEPEAVRRLLDEAAPVLYGFVYARVGGDEAVAEDLVQETLLEAVRSAHTFRGESALSTWLCAIARRRLARHWEAERRREEARRHLTVLRGDEWSAASEDDFSERDVVIRALGRLSAVHREVLVRKYLDGSSVAEIAAGMGRSRVQVQSLLQRARDSLRKLLEPGAGG